MEKHQVSQSLVCNSTLTQLMPEKISVHAVLIELGGGRKEAVTATESNVNF
jgi:hypothetical protein